jgi:diacylglycerol O-acyltransferase
MELPSQPMQTMALAILRPPEGADGAPVPITLEDVRRRVARSLPALPAFRLRVQPIPLGLHRPVLVDAADFDPDRHLDHVTLSPPGGPAELDRLFASLAGRCLDVAHPLWRMTLVDGLEAGRQALIVEIHHSLMDGVALVNNLGRLFAAEDSLGTLWALSRPPHRAPERWRLVTGAVVEHGRGLARLPGLIRKTKRGAAAIQERAAASAVRVPKEGTDTPSCSLNPGLTSGRRFARASLPLDDVRAVKDLAGVTVNDVVLAVVGGALRDYLIQRDELPQGSLVANVPVARKTPEDPFRVIGNRLTRLVTTLATDVADPWERLETIGAVTRESKHRLDLMGREILDGWLDLVPPGIFQTEVRRGHERRSSQADFRPDTNVTVSNIRGPAKPWSFGASLVEELYMTAPPNSAAGVTFLVADYAGALGVGILSFAESVQSPAELAAGLSRSLQQLVRR